MTVDAILAIAHHLAAFGLVGALVGELVLVRGPMPATDVRRFSRLDAAYGIAALAVVAIGIGRIALGPIPTDFYLGNAFFWTKMAALGAITIVSIGPTVRSMRWGRAFAADPAFAVPPDELAATRRSVTIEVLIIPLVPVSAALMARGIGAL
jgi:putative membrane protein